MPTPSPTVELQCQPRLPHSCICSEFGSTRTDEQRSRLPSCVASAACDATQWSGPAFREEHAHRTSIGIFFGFNRSRVRHVFSSQPFASYLKDIALAMRLVLSLRRVNTRLPIQLHISGERHERYEQKFLEQGVELVPAPEIRLPSWANPWHAGTFSKLAALSVAGSDRVIVLDVDTVVFRNIDHLSGAPTPSLVYVSNGCGATCCWEINSGVMVLKPSPTEHARLLARLEAGSKSRKTPGDGGDQSFWRKYFDQVYELPAVYNAEKRNNVSNWSSIYVLHDLWGPRWAKWWVDMVRKTEPDVIKTYNQLTVSATRQMTDGLERRDCPLNKTRVVCYSKNTMRLCDEDPFWRPS
jgi:hypothetical protein